MPKHVNSMLHLKYTILSFFKRKILWTLLYLGDNVYYIYAARVLAGITGGGMFALVPLFVADIADRR